MPGRKQLNGLQRAITRMTPCTAERRFGDVRLADRASIPRAQAHTYILEPEMLACELLTNIKHPRLHDESLLGVVLILNLAPLALRHRSNPFEIET